MIRLITLPTINGKVYIFQAAMVVKPRSPEAVPSELIIR